MLAPWRRADVTRRRGGDEYTGECTVGLISIRSWPFKSHETREIVSLTCVTNTRERSTTKAVHILCIFCAYSQQHIPGLGTHETSQSCLDFSIVILVYFILQLFCRRFCSVPHTSVSHNKRGGIMYYIIKGLNSPVQRRAWRGFLFSLLELLVQTQHFPRNVINVNWHHLWPMMSSTLVIRIFE